MPAEAPGHTGKAGGVSPVQFVFIVEVKGGAERLFRTGVPLQNLFSPVHAHVIVHLPDRAYVLQTGAIVLEGTGPTS